MTFVLRKNVRAAGVVAMPERARAAVMVVAVEMAAGRISAVVRDAAGVMSVGLVMSAGVVMVSAASCLSRWLD
jgi:hypothetical protein